MGAVEERDRFDRALARSLGRNFPLSEAQSEAKVREVERRLGFPLPQQVKDLALAPGGTPACYVGQQFALSWGSDLSMVGSTEFVDEPYGDGSLYGPEVPRRPFVAAYDDSQCSIVVEPDRSDGSPGRLIVVCSDTGSCNVYARSAESMFRMLAECAEADLFLVRSYAGGPETIDWWFTEGDDYVLQARLEEIRARYPGEGEILLPLLDPIPPGFEPDVEVAGGTLPTPSEHASDLSSTSGVLEWARIPVQIPVSSSSPTQDQSPGQQILNDLVICERAGGNAFFAVDFDWQGETFSRGCYRFDSCIPTTRWPEGLITEWACDDDLIRHLSDLGMEYAIVGNVLYVGRPEQISELTKLSPSLGVVEQVLEEDDIAAIRVISEFIRGEFSVVEMSFPDGSSGRLHVIRMSMSWLTDTRRRSLLEVMAQITKMTPDP